MTATATAEHTGWDWDAITAAAQDTELDMGELVDGSDWETGAGHWSAADLDAAIADDTARPIGAPSTGVTAAADLLAGALDSGDPVYLEHIARQAVADLRRLLGA